MAKRKRSDVSSSGVRRFRKMRKTMRRSRLASRVPQRQGNWRPLPMRNTIKFHYSTQILQDPGSGSVTDYMFSANGLYDPDISGTGHQPYGFDQLMEMYAHYTVIGSKIKVRLVNNGNDPIWTGVLLRNSNTTLSGTNISQLMEQPGSNFRLIGTVMPTPAIYTKGFSAKKFFGQKAIVGQSLYRGDVSANPTEQAYFHIVQGGQGGNDPPATTVWVDIEYTAVLTEPSLLSQS